MKFQFFAVTLASVIGVAVAAQDKSAQVSKPAAGVFTLEKFLSTVQEHNQGYKAAKDAEEAAKLYSSEGGLVYATNLFSTLQYSDDAKPSFIPTFNYDKIITQNYTLGLGQQTPIGLQGKLYYSMVQTEYRGLIAPYSEGRPTIELTQSLWRNDFGREVRAQVKAITSAAKATQHSEAFNKQSQLFQAEAAYWRLALARQSHELSKENLARAERIYGWAKRRVQLSLADRSDLLQTSSGWQARKLEFKTATDELRAASVAFNNARGTESDQVPEALEPISKEMIDRLKIPERASDRQDVLAAQQQSEAVKAQAVINREKNQPVLEVFGAYSFNSREANKDEAWTESWDGQKPTKVVGLRFSSPLALGRLSDTQEGYARQIKSAEQRYERQRFLQEQDWRDLVLRFNEAKERLGAAEELEKTQREKLDYERQRQERGRTTLFQVLNFETDYLNAQGVRLRTLAELLQIAAQMKLYGVNL
ncbi:MAG: TolC family protein [Bdellovibrionales bacterium]